MLDPKKIDTGGSAFPSETDEKYMLGITKRDYFATKAMAAIISTTPANSELPTTTLAAKGAYAYADEMLKARTP